MIVQGKKDPSSSLYNYLLQRPSLSRLCLVCSGSSTHLSSAPTKGRSLTVDFVAGHVSLNPASSTNQLYVQKRSFQPIWNEDYDPLLRGLWNVSVSQYRTQPRQTHTECSVTDSSCHYCESLTFVCSFNSSPASRPGPSPAHTPSVQVTVFEAECLWPQMTPMGADSYEGS